ncbi:MAG: ABC transporter ATP-binding protein [Gammaproteobacteria bacterium]|nr:MAG: ABC transporter ATP-binding protein [Gammaproteobacteria bacterium]
MSTKLIEVKDMRMRFPLNEHLLDQLKIKNGKLVRQRDFVHAVNGVSFDVYQGEALCVVGESGCGKSTVARMIIGLLQLSDGEVHYQGKRIDTLSSRQMKPYHRKMQMIFQNPYASLNPRMTIKQTLAEPIRFHNPGISSSELQEKIDEVMASVGVDQAWAGRYPHEFSGGQRQRISIARALAVDPEFIVADEPISALDVSIQAQVLNLMMEAQEKRNLTYLFITHDLSVVEHFGTRVAVMYLGTVCELANTRTLFDNPLHPYTKALLSAIPKLKDERPNHIRLKGEVPTPVNLPTGCAFNSRCVDANERCIREIPRLIATDGGHQVACHGIEEGRL